MSEATDETTEPNPDAEPEVEPEHIDGGDEAQEQEQEAVKPAGPSSEAVMQAADKENRRYMKKLETILGPDEARHECVYCNGLGVAWGEQGATPDYVHPDNLVMCETCNGWGQVLTGAKNEMHYLAMCIKCAGNGYETVPAQPSNVATITPYTPPTDQPIAGQFVPGKGFIPYGSTEPIPGSLTG